MRVILDAKEAKNFVEKLLDNNSFIEAQWVVGLDKNGKEYGKYVSEDSCGIYGDDFRFGNDDDTGVEDRATVKTWVLTNLPQYGDVAVVYC